LEGEPCDPVLYAHIIDYKGKLEWLEKSYFQEANDIRQEYLMKLSNLAEKYHQVGEELERQAQEIESYIRENYGPEYDVNIYTGKIFKKEEYKQ